MNRPRVVHGGIDVEAILQRHVVVFAPVAGGGVDCAGSGFQGHMSPEDYDRIAVGEGVAGFEAA